MSREATRAHRHFRGLAGSRSWTPPHATAAEARRITELAAALVESGLRAVFIPNAFTWVVEEDEIDPDDEGVLHLERFADLLKHF